MNRKLLLLSIAITLLSRHHAIAEVFVFHHEHVLGTSCELILDCKTLTDAQRAEQLALGEIERLAAILSSHDSDSELMRLQELARTSKTTDEVEISNDLRAVLERAERWRLITGGAFDVRAAALTQLWQIASQSNRIPSGKERRQITSQFAEPPYVLSATGIRLTGELAISVDALAKGYILDRVTERLMQQPDVAGCCLNIGGDLRKRGRTQQTISITDPAQTMEGASPKLTFQFDRDLVLCTSGNYRRHVNVAGRRFSHIFDPRSGLPVGHVASASVISENAMDSDALATTLSVLPPEAGLELVSRSENVECALILQSGEMMLSDGWPTGHHQQHYVADKASKRSAEGLIVDFTLNRPEGRRYRRPYVAIWLEDEDGFPVKTAVLWMQTEQPGPRWHRDLTRWYRNDRMRKTVEKSDLIETISGATRGPGEYQALFDGTDNLGKQLPEGKYTLCLEVAREHGTYQIIREPLELTGEAIAEKKLKGNVEMSKVSFQFIPPNSVPATVQ